MKLKIQPSLTRAVIFTFAGFTGLPSANAQPNRYTDTILVANDASYNPLRFVDPLIGNGWGIAIRPPGAGGHFWISNASTGTTTTYVGDSHTPTGFVPLFQDALKSVIIPIGAGTLSDGRPVSELSIPTGQVFNHSATDFVVSGEGITGAAKFIFVTADGTISGWTETRDAQNNPIRQTQSVIMVDHSHQFIDERLIYTGCAVTEFPSNNRLYVVNWNGERVEVYDNAFQPIPIPADRFKLPVQGEIWRAWNIQYLHTGPGGAGRLWVTFNKAEDPWEEYPEFGAVGEFDLDGNLIRTLKTSADFDPFADGELRDPWGLAIAPANFGPLAGKMLVANFGDGTIAAFDLQSNRFFDFVRGNDGRPLVVDGIWGITFGNGVALGDSDALYYAAGPNGELDGTFGTVRLTSTLCPVIQTGPVSVNACGVPQTLAASVSAPGPTHVTYQWEVQTSPQTWAPLTDGQVVSGAAVVAGATTPQLAISRPASLLSPVSVRVIVSTVCGSTTSAPAALRVCIADFDCVGGIQPQDIFAYIGAYFAGQPAADLDGNGLTPSDIFGFLNAYFAGC